MVTEDPCESLHMAIVFHARDWAADRRDAWIWGIVVGWDDESLADIASRFGWDRNMVARLKRLRIRFSSLTDFRTP